MTFLREWRVITSPPLTGAQNMALDEAIAESVREGGRPTLRFYGWRPPAVSIGYFQDLQDAVDLAACRSREIDVVRRPTGGRAVLHHMEVTYSVAVSEKDPHIPKNVTDSYRVLSEGIVLGLRRLGADAEMVSLNTKRRQRQARRDQEPTSSRTGQVVMEADAPAGRSQSAACFDAPSWYEIVVSGRKIVGSAQTRRYGVLLQHGSILLDLDIDLLFEVLSHRSPEAKERAKALFARKATSLRQALGKNMPFHGVAEAVQEGFAQVMAAPFYKGALTDAEESRAARLRADKYSSDHWNLGRRL